MKTSAESKGGKYAFISHYLWLLAVPMIIGLGAIILQFQLLYRTAQEQKLQALNHAAALSETETLTSLEQTLELLVASERINTIDDSHDHREYYRKLWLEQTHINPLIDSIFFADSEGQWFSSDVHSNLNSIPQNRPWYQATLLNANSLTWSRPYDDGPTKKKTVTLSYAIVNPDISQEPLVLGLDVEMSNWAERIAGLIGGDNAVRHMVIDRTSGQMILHNNPALIGTTLTQPWRPLLVGQSGSFLAYDRGEGGDSDAYVAYEALSNNANWFAITIQRERDTFQQQQLLLIAIILVFSSSLFVVLALLFRHRLAGIIDSLTLMVRQLRLSPDRRGMVLPSIPGLDDLNVEVSLVSDHLQENIKQATLDALTGLYNRRHLNERLAKLQEQHTSVVLAMVDIDNFKSINDTFGHALGDTVLRRVAALGLESLGERATLFRYGGEELVAIFELDSLKEAERQMERWRVEVVNSQWREENLVVTFSAGIGANEGQTMEALLGAVDQALYRAKEEGKNRIYRVKSE